MRLTGYLSMIREHEEHGMQFAHKGKAQVAARIETQRTGVKHTHHLTTTYRNFVERLCWTIVPVGTARAALAQSVGKE